MIQKHFFVTFFLSVLTISLIPLYGQVEQDSSLINKPANFERDSLIRLSIENINHENYDRVFKLTDLLIEKFPDDPSGYFLTADAYQTIMRDYRVNIYEAEFDSLIHRAVDVSKQAVERNPIAENYFIYGASEGYRCRHWFRTGNWLKAIGAAIKTVKMLRKALEKDPEFVDPILGLALYDYAKSKVQLLGLSLFSDNTEQIIAKFNTVYNKSRFLSMNALFSLQLIYFEIGDIDRTEEVNDKLLSLFPQHPVCHYYRALIFEEQDRLIEAEQQWLTVMERIENFNPSSNNYLAECNYHLAKMTYHRGQLNQARAYLREAARCIRNYNEGEELDGALYTFDDIKNQINEALKNWNLY